MPVILDPSDYDLWLDPGMQNVDAASDLLRPFDSSRMRAHPVSTRLNNVANDNEECARPVELSEGQAQLFPQVVCTQGNTRTGHALTWRSKKKLQPL